MTRKKLREIALRLVSKGYDWEQIRWSDDLYNATKEERDMCHDFVDEIKENGTKNFDVDA